ncbi:MAG: molybdopterin-dependent oxidoreductase [Bryobacteraceae bacterium]|nr:molybdopterin-dependent oxidoreductase [Bryobacteraceae bacterium]
MSNPRRSFLKFGLGGVALGFGLRQALSINPHEWNEAVTRRLFGARRLTPTFPASQAKDPRANGDVGLEEEVQDWQLRIEDPSGQRQLTLAQLQALPTNSMTTELMCVEGWSQVVSWKGTPLRNIAPAQAPEYVSLKTPDELYYVGLDLESALHPQTLLAWEMNGQPLTPEHGAPLRLVIPVKYGIKNIKRIGTIQFTPHRPKDYWNDRGYDWYAAL